MLFQLVKSNISSRRKLLGTVSALALTGLFQIPGEARAGDNGGADPETHVTLDIAGQFTMTGGGRTIYGDPSGPTPFVGTNDGGDGLVALNLERNGWIYGISVNFGRTAASHGAFSFSTPTYFGYYTLHETGAVRHTETHKIVDFTIGQDVGLGMFGIEGTSVVSGGIEWANFSADTAGSFSYDQKYYGSGQVHTSSFDRSIHRHFHGFGPVISWNASTPFLDPGCHLSLTWGATAAVLFGNRNVKIFDTGSLIRAKGATVPRASAYLGVGWHPDGSRFAFSAGYAVSATWGVFDRVFDIDGDEPGLNVSRVTHGPYADVTIQLQ